MAITVAMKTKLKTIFMVLTIICLSVWLAGCSESKNDKNLEVSGTVEATQVNINSEIAGKLKEVLIEEGTTIKEGRVLAKIDSTIQALQVQQAEAALASARESSQQTKSGNREQLITQARAGVEQVDALLKGAKESTKNALDNLNRITALVRDGGATTQQLLDAETRYNVAQAQVDAYTAQKKSAQEQLVLLKDGSTREAINIANAGVAQAQANLEIAKAQLAKTIIYAPMSGILTDVNFKKGEFVSPGTAVFTVLDPQDMWIKVYLSEKDLPRIKIGQKADVYVDAYPAKRFEGKVSYISAKAEFTPKNLQTAEERVNMVFAVKIRITDGKEQLKPGLPADVKIIL